MARTHSILGINSGALGDMIYYTRFGKTFVRHRAKTHNDCQSEAQLRQRALFKAIQRTSALFGTILQRGLTKYAHSQGHTEANEFARLNKRHFVYENGMVQIDYPTLRVARGPLTAVEFTSRHVEGPHVTLTFTSEPTDSKCRPDDVVHIYVVAPRAEICELVASEERQTGQVSFDLPDLREEGSAPETYHLYAIVEAATTAHIPTLSAAEKQIDKKHRNINRRVSKSVFVGSITLK